MRSFDQFLKAWNQLALVRRTEQHRQRPVTELRLDHVIGFSLAAWYYLR